MAFDKEFLQAHFQGVEKADERIGAIMAEYEKANLPLVKNRDDILGEKKALEKRLSELQEKYTGLETANKELNEKLESGLPDKEKQIYQAEIEKLKSVIGRMTEESGKMKTEYDATVGKLSAEKSDYILNEEIAKLINANPAVFEAAKGGGLAKRFFADYPKQEFEPYDYGGKKEYVNKAGKKMSDLLTEFLATDEGKIYLRATSSGGGASGSSGGKPPATVNPFEKGKENLDAQARLLKENPALFAQLKEQAGKPA